MRSRLKIFLPIAILVAGVGIAFLLITNRKVIQPAPVTALSPLVRVTEAIGPYAGPARHIVGSKGTS